MKTTGTVKLLLAALAILAVTATFAAWWGYGHLTELVQRQLQSYASETLTVGRVLVRWNRVELENIQIARRGTTRFGRRLAIQHLVLQPRLTSLFSKRLELGTITIDKPYLLVEIAPDGSLIKPLSDRPSTPDGKRAKPLPVAISALRIHDGTIDVLDWHAARRGGEGLSNPHEQYHCLQFNGINLDLGEIDIPLMDKPTALRLAMKSQGGGDLTLSGVVSPQSMDSTLKLEVKNLDIVGYRPYYLKKGDLDVTAGLMTIQTDIAIKKRQLAAPGIVILKGLAFEHSGLKGFWKGIPAWALVHGMSDNAGELKVNFSVNGDLDNPRFKIRQSFVEQLAAGLSSGIGLTGPARIGKGFIDAGSSGVKGLLKMFGR